MFALFFAIILRGFQLGSYSRMKQNAIESYSGYLQIQKKGYWDDKNINNVFAIDSSVVQKLESDKRVKVIVPRLESFALASSGESTKGAMIMGISPEKENTMTRFSNYLVKGEMISEKDRQVMIAEDLAKFLKVHVGDSLVLISSGYHGASAAGLYPVKGILKLPIPEMNRSLIYLPIKEAQNFFGTGNRFTALAVDLYDMDDVSGITAKASQELDTGNYAVIRWEEMNKELLQMIETDNAGGLIMVGILYMVIAFGIFGTVLMMTSERRKEFAMMISIGMRRWKLTLVVIFELILLSILGVIAGILISLPVMLYFYKHPIRFTGDVVKIMQDFNFEPIMPVSLEPNIFITQALVIFIISLFAMYYPIRKIASMNIVNDLRG
jgi:ABC-type lipoprotein release transport system permease subunit